MSVSAVFRRSCNEQAKGSIIGVHDAVLDGAGVFRADPQVERTWIEGAE
jgi:hypothetical protein